MHDPLQVSGTSTRPSQLLTPNGEHKSPARVAAVIVTFESAEVIAACITALRAASEGVELVSLSLVDNGSSDDSLRIATDVCPDIRVEKLGVNLGYAAGINRGHDISAPHDFLLILNPDTVLQGGAIARMAESVELNGGGIVVPRLTDENGAISFNQRRWPSLTTALAEAALGGRLAARLGWGEVVARRQQYEQRGPVEWATGAALMIDSAGWDKLGPWDTTFFLYSEETEYMLRAHRAAMPVYYEPNAVCMHRGGESGTSPRLWSMLMANKVRLYKRSHGRVASTAFQSVLLLGQLARAIAGSRTARAATRSLIGPLGSATAAVQTNTEGGS